MKTLTWRNLRRRLVPPLVLAAALGAAAAYRAELTAWFSGTPIASGNAHGTRTALGTATLTASLNPAAPRQQGNTLQLWLADEDERPISDANVAVSYFMPAMGAMPEMRGNADVTASGDGVSVASFDLPMSGTWELIVSTDLGDGPVETRFSITVGAKGLTAKTEGVSGSGDDEIAYHTCSMHPSVKSDEPGACPICSMDLTPVTKGEQRSGVLRLDGERTQQIGVRYAAARRKPLSRSVLAVGEVNADENKLTDVSLRTGGWIEKLRVEETGEYVKKGQSLLELYSPDILAASEEVLAARRATGPVRARLVAGADRKLLLLGVTPSQLRRLVSRGKARDRISVSSPTNGYVVEKNVVEGDHVEQGMSLLRIADLSKVWVDAQVYEADLPLVKLGQTVSVTLPFVPGQRFSGAVGYIHPRLDPQTRTVRVRIVLDNPELALRPGMYADVRIDVDLGERLVIPQESVVYSGTRRLVFVDLGEGRLQPKEIEVGVRASGMIEVRDGLAAGDRVVSSGNFLIAAESRIRSATTIWAQEPDDPQASAGGEAPPTSSHDHAGPSYTCPMHPEVHEHEPGQCRICHMDLEVRDATAGEADPSTDDEPAGSKVKREPKAPRASPRRRRDKHGPKAPVAVTKPRPEPKVPAPAPRPESSAHYTCSMHPQVVKDAPGQCPICHMNLVEKKGAKQ